MGTDDFVSVKLTECDADRDAVTEALKLSEVLSVVVRLALPLDDSDLESENVSESEKE